MSGVWLCALIACSYTWNSHAARILVVVPSPSYSHQSVFRPISRELALRGHRVVVLTTDPAFQPDQAPPNLTEIDLHDASYSPWINRVVKAATGKENELYTQVDNGFAVMVEIFAKQMRTEAVKKLLADKKEQFNLVIAEAWIRPGLAFGHIYNAPVILLTTLGGLDEQYELMGGPVDPVLYPDVLRTRLYNLTLWEKVTELYNRYLLRRMMLSYEAKEDDMLREVFGEGMPPLEKLKVNVELLMVNMDPTFEGYRPVPPNVIHLGGLNCAAAKKMPEELQLWLDSSKHGVIYISFGTNSDPSLLPPDQLAVFSRVFGQLPYDVLWKWKDPPAGLPDNVRTSGWLPQSDLLRHSKVLLFITQAGLQSTDEALHAGVPLLAFPLLGDQWFNAEQYERLGVGRRLSLTKLTEQELRDAIEGIIHDEGYRSRAKLLGQELQDRPETALNRAVWWIERTLRRRTPRRRSRTAPVCWMHYVDSDVVAVAIVVFIGAVLAIFSLYHLLVLVTKRVLKVKTS